MITPHQAAVASFPYIKAHLPQATSARTTLVSCSTNNYIRFICKARTNPASLVLNFDVLIRHGKFYFIKR